MLRLGVAALLVGYLPGMMLFRVPFADRSRRARLPAEERAFWYVVLSVAWSLATVLGLAAADSYTFQRLLIANTAVTIALVIVARGRIGFASAAARVSWTALLPIALLALGFWRFLPPTEYVIGGKDPGVYLSEGVQIAKSGSLVIREPVLADVPADQRDLFVPSHHVDSYYGVRFMGFWVQDPVNGQVIGQFPQLFPASIAIGFNVAGVDGARVTVACWAVLGLVAVYMLGARLFGPVAAFAAASLLGLHVIQLWYARSPNSDVVMQALLFAGLLAFARAQQDEDRFFAPIAGALLALLLFLRVDALLAIVAAVSAGGVAWLVDRRALRASFGVMLAIGLVFAWLYLSGPMRGYFWLPLTYLRHLPLGPLAVAVGTAGLVIFALARLRHRFSDRLHAVIPIVMAVALVLLCGYALFLRVPLRPSDSKLALHDASALITFTDLYLFWPGLLAALAGVVIVFRRDFWRDPALMFVFTAFAIFFFYKVRIVPEHFWMARRFLPVILPAALLFGARAALGPAGGGGSLGRQGLRSVAGAVFLCLLGWQYHAAAAPIESHREYQGIIRAVEQLASRFGPRDLVIVEGRNAGQDTHVFALPLAYLYDRQVLVLDSPRPDKAMLSAFLAQALQRHDRVLFVGGGGTDLLARRIAATPVGDGRIQVPEYEVTPWTRYPQRSHRKDFDYSIYQLLLDTPQSSPFVLDVGFQDDLHVVRFHAKERTEGRTIRWTGPQSFVSVAGLTGSERTFAVVMHDGGRPSQAPRAQVQVFFNEVLLGVLEVGKGFKTYTLPLPADAVRAAAGQNDPVVVRLVSSVWSPKQLLLGNDDRELGVMLDSVEIH